MAKRTATTDINHENWDQEEVPEVSGTFQAAPAAVLATRQIKRANRRLHLDKSSSTGIVSGTNVAEVKSCSKSVLKAPVSVFQNLGTTFFSRPEQIPAIGLNQSTTMFPLTNPKDTSNLPATMLSTTSTSFQNRPTCTSNAKEPAKFSVGYPTVDRSKCDSMDLNSAGIKLAGTDHTVKPPHASTSLETKSVTESSSCSPAEALDKMDSRRLLKPVPEDILERLRAKAVATSKSLNFLKRIYQLNTTTTDWLNLLIQEDLTINISDVIPSYMQELSKLVDEEIASQESKAVKAALLPHQKQLQKMLAIFRECGRVNENGSSMEPKSENLPNNTSDSISMPNSNSVMNQLQSPQSIRVMTNQDTAWQGTNANKEEKDDPKKKPGIGFFMTMQSAPTTVSEKLAVKPENTEQGEVEESDDEASKDNPFTPVMETDSVCSMRCKVFVKRDSSEASDTPYQNRGVGMLFVKPMTTGKVQVVVRADNSLGNIIMNVCITSEMPVQVANNTTLMLVCCPMQGEPPRTVLIRVKNKEEVELLHKNLVTI